MQGLAGTYGINDKGLVKSMLRCIRHRGQDDEMLYETDRIAIGAGRRRLQGDTTSRSIATKDDLAVVSDSYLYNRDALQESLLNKRDPSATDSQIILEMFERMGASAINYLNGAFAIAIVKGNELILARDRFGLKPLYISLDDNIGAFSSEMKSQMITDDDFKPFPPGLIWSTVHGGQSAVPKVIRNFMDVYNDDRSTFLRSLIERSVKQCMSYSNETNVLLSGGLDSSIIAFEAVRQGKKVHTLCVGMEDCGDIDAARMVAEHLGTDHTERTYGIEEMVDILDDVIYSLESFDLPLVRSSIPNYIAAHAFKEKEHVTVCGEGSDEIFGGYEHMVELDDESLRDERMRLIYNSYATGFQRVDRVTSSASLDARMPFMDSAIVDFGLRIEAKDLVDSTYGLSKIALRQAYSGRLPEEVVQRRKRRFGEGAGSLEALQGFANHAITDEEFEKESAAVPFGRIRNKEELLYYRLFREHFDLDCCLQMVGMTTRI